MSQGWCNIVLNLASKKKDRKPTFGERKHTVLQLTTVCKDE